MPLTDIDGQRLGDSVADKLGNRNLIINGAMLVAQRGTSFTSQTAGAYYLDRFEVHTFTLGSGVFQADQSTDAPDGFEKSFKLSCTTADTSTDANAQMSVYQALEGLDTNFLKYFQASPDTVTISFYVKSNRTGTFSAALKLSDNGSSWGDGNTRIYNFTYSISAANTWERKTASITLDSATTETKVVDENFAVSIQWWQLAGTSRDGATANSWVDNTNAASASTNLDLLESTNNNWFITGVQLEVGNTATPFEHRSYADELFRCQRYFYAAIPDASNVRFALGIANATNRADVLVPLPREMRASPSVAFIKGTTVASFQLSDTGTGHVAGTIAVHTDCDSRSIMNLQVTKSASATNLTAFRPYFLEANQSTACLGFDAEI